MVYRLFTWLSISVSPGHHRVPVFLSLGHCSNMRCSRSTNCGGCGRQFPISLGSKKAIHSSGNGWCGSFAHSLSIYGRHFTFSGSRICFSSRYKLHNVEPNWRHHMHHLLQPLRAVTAVRSPGFDGWCLSFRAADLGQRMGWTAYRHRKYLWVYTRITSA